MPAAQAVQTPIDLARPRPARRVPTIGVTLRLDPPRCRRLKDMSAQFDMTGQSIMRQGLDAKLDALERRARNVERAVQGQISLFADWPEQPLAAADAARADEPPEPPEPTIGVGYRATEPMHRWLHAEADRRGISIQELITDALARLGAPRD